MNDITVVMLDETCERCGKFAHELRTFPLQETITYYRKELYRPWLCIKCFVRVKEKFWATATTTGDTRC